MKLLRILAMALVLGGCAGGHRSTLAMETAGVTQRGSVVRVEPLGHMDEAQLQSIADDFPGDIQVKNGADLYRVVYWTVLHGTPVQASGLLSLPTDRDPKGMVMYLHGTNLTRALSPSQPDRADGNEETAVFAGNGYAVVLPDYIGLGVSHEPQAYLVTEAQVDASLDMLTAVRAVMTSRQVALSPSLFVMGFSEGGQSAAAVHRELEAHPRAGIDLKCTVAIAGPYDLEGIFREKMMPPQVLEARNVGYIALTAYAYAAYYGHPLDEVFAPDYAQSLPRLFDGSKGPETIIPALPDDARDLFTPEFAGALASDKPNWFTAALAENQTWQWSPKAPLRLYYGESDEDVPPATSKVFYDHARAVGGNVSLTSWGAVDHQASAAMTYAPALAWFDALTGVDPS